MPSNDYDAELFNRLPSNGFDAELFNRLPFNGYDGVLFNNLPPNDHDAGLFNPLPSKGYRLEIILYSPSTIRSPLNVLKYCTDSHIRYEPS